MVVDFQPEYYPSFKTKIKIDEYLRLIEKYAMKGRVLYFYNSIYNQKPEEKVLGESITRDILVEWLGVLYDKFLGYGDEKIRRIIEGIRFYAKGYGFVRLWVDKEKDEDIGAIKREARRLYKRGDENVVRLVEFLKSEVKGVALMTGGFKTQCVAEIEALLEVAKIPYKEHKRFVV